MDTTEPYQPPVGIEPDVRYYVTETRDAVTTLRHGSDYKVAKPALAEAEEYNAEERENAASELRPAREIYGVVVGTTTFTSYAPDDTES